LAGQQRQQPADHREGAEPQDPEATKGYARLMVTPVRNAMEEATSAIRRTGEL
jgi:hypothetical protein